MPKRDCRYKTLAELKAAYDSGELDRRHFLTLEHDEDDAAVYERDDEGCFTAVTFGNPLFTGNTEELLEEALTLLGIPWESN